MAAEIEILVMLQGAKEDALACLSKRYEAVRVDRTHDKYLTHPSIPLLIPSEEMALTGALRIRTTQHSSKVTAKRDLFNEDGSWSHSDEVEFKVDDVPVAAAFFELLGFRPLLDVKMEKSFFEGRGFEVVLEVVEELGLFLEIEEKMHPDWPPAERKARVQAELDAIGLAYTRPFDGGKPELLLKKRSGLTLS